MTGKSFHGGLEKFKKGFNYQRLGGEIARPPLAHTDDSILVGINSVVAESQRAPTRDTNPRVSDHPPA